MITALTTPRFCAPAVQATRLQELTRELVTTPRKRQTQLHNMLGRCARLIIADD